MVDVSLDQFGRTGLSGSIEGYLPLLERLDDRPPVSGARTRLVEEAIQVWARPGFDAFVSLPRLRFEPFPHQLQAAATVLRRMRGRALLADEVGLGKTIEAGLVLSELRLRGLASRVLVLVPAGLVGQWQEELERKFALPSVIARSRGSDPPAQGGEPPIVIASLAAARRDPLRAELTGEGWDLVVVDEAHRTKSPRSVSGRLVRSLRSRYLLLLTATPVENRLDDAFHLVNLVRPGHLGTPAQFRSRHRLHHGSSSPNLAALRGRLGEVMVRHRRSQVALMLPTRLAETRTVAPTDEEAELYRLVSERVRAEGRGAPQARAMSLRAVQRLAGSSPAALAPTLERVGWGDLARRALAADDSEKARVLTELLRRHHRRGDKVVVFTAFRHTLDFLAGRLAAAGLPPAVYHGGLSRREKDAAIAAFASEAPVLVSTEAAGEGRNLQFCHVMVNFDLPWNPMQIEQRLGRIHRIGQNRDVVLTNLVGRGTIEERILRVLETKINVFELVVGELDMIIGRVDDDLDFESFVYQAHVTSRDDDEFTTRLDSLGEELARARVEYLDSRSRTDELVGEQQ